MPKRPKAKNIRRSELARQGNPLAAVAQKSGGALAFIKHAPLLPLLLFISGCVMAGFVALADAGTYVAATPWRDIITHHLSFIPEDADRNFAGYAFVFLREQWVFLLVCLTPAFLVTLYRLKGSALILPILMASLAIFALWLSSDLYENYASASESFLGEAPTLASYVIKLVLIGAVILSPPVLLAIYFRSSTLDRYVVRSFAVPFVLCLFGFLTIWVIIDLADNGPDFIDAEHPPTLTTILFFYIVQIPQVVVLILDVTLLLAMLYTLGKMSKANEIISMMGAGRSIVRILLPLFSIGLLATLVSLAFNYEWAPSAEREKEDLLRSMDEGFEQQTAAQATLFRNREDRRTWFVSSIPIDFAADNKMRSLEIYQQDEDGQIEKAYVADSAFWFAGLGDKSAGTWRLYHGVVRDYDERGIPFPTPFSSIDIDDWAETPWKLQSGALNPEFLGVQELRSYIATNHELPADKLAPFRTQQANRWALPWRCFVVTLIAAPLGIVFSRRGLLGGVASCVFIYFLIFFLTSVFLALGDSNRLYPPLAAWLTNIIFAAVGLLLLWARSKNRQLPNLNPLALFRRASA